MKHRLLKLFALLITLSFPFACYAQTQDYPKDIRDGKYDQTVVEVLELRIMWSGFGIIELDEWDYEVLVIETNYALDDAENASDFDKWRIDNKKEYNFLCHMDSFLNFHNWDEVVLPESVESEIVKLWDRMDEFFESFPED